MNWHTKLKKIPRLICRGFFAIAVVTTLVACVRAEPITLAFEAEVTAIDINQGSQLSLPFTIAIGDQISGSIDFEPVLFGQATVTNRLSLELFGYSLEGTSASLVTRDNQALTPWVDSIITNNDFLTTSTDILGVDLQQLGLSIATAGNLITAGEDLSDVEVWNRIPPLPATVGIPSERQVAFQLTSPSGLFPMTVFAEIGQMQVVPEPTTLMLASITTKLIFVTVVRRFVN